MITCRRARSEDTVLFREIRLKALKESPEAFGSTYDSAHERTMESWQEQLESTVKGSLRNKQFAFDADESVGIAVLYREEGIAHGDIIMMWVDERYRGSDVASLIISNLIEWARGVGMESVYLTVMASNKRAICFYKKCGFEMTNEEIDIETCRGVDSIRMKKSLSD